MVHFGVITACVATLLFLMWSRYTPIPQCEFSWNPWSYDRVVLPFSRLWDIGMVSWLVMLNIFLYYRPFDAPDSKGKITDQTGSIVVSQVINMFFLTYLIIGNISIFIYSLIPLLVVYLFKLATFIWDQLMRIDSLYYGYQHFKYWLYAEDFRRRTR